MEDRDPAGASRSDDQIFLAVAVEIDPGDTWTELAEGVGQQRLALKVVEVGLDVRVAAELGGDIFEERFLRRVRRPSCVVRGAGLCDLVLAIGRRTVDYAAPPVAPIDFDSYMRRRPGREREARVGARQVQPAGQHLAFL